MIFLKMTRHLCMDTDNSYRLVTNMRGTVPHYYAVWLVYDRLYPDKLQPASTRYVVSSIVDLAAQHYKHGGGRSTANLAWPLFVVAWDTHHH